MDDLISRQAAIDRIESLTRTWGGDDGVYPLTETDKAFNYAIEVAASCVYNLPSAQQEIILCKDCKYYGRVDKRRFYRGMDCLNKHIDTIIPDKDFCSKAERREDG